ncbi:unnamed protein product [Somion occarium]|uniref:Uncharacterized protein n=2 Tax=Somion occarium TaxID=3059160 RepID=A0ABP1CJ04_9APHY
MLFTRNFVFSVLAFIFVGSVAAVPMPMPLRRSMERREPAPLEVIPAYLKRADVNTTPAEIPTKAPAGQIEPYKRDEVKRQDVNNLPAEIATKAPTGQIEPYNRRELEEFEKRKLNAKRADLNTTPAEIPTKAPAGQIEPYKRSEVKRQDVNKLPAEIATKAPTGQIEPYNKREYKRGDIIPSELPTRSIDGVIELI